MELCNYCNRNPGFKTNGNGEVICESRAFTGKCKFGGEDTVVQRKPIVKTEKLGRNDPCSCGSRKKYKNCCLV